MSSLFKSNYYNREFLIIDFIILLYEYYFTRSERYRILIVILVLLNENVHNSKVKNISFHSIFFLKIIVSKKKNRYKDIF